MQTLPVDLSSRPSDAVVFSSLTWRSLFLSWRGSMGILRGNHRQAADQQYAATLERLRLVRHEPADIHAINDTWNNFTDEQRLKMPQLRALNTSVDTYNNEQLQLLPGEAMAFDAADRAMGVTDEDNAKAREQLRRLGPSRLLIKEQAPVIATRRLSKTVPTGTVGVVLALTASGCMCSFKGERITLQRKEWVVYNESGRVVGQRLHLPVLLAWAVTIHRAQGSELDSVCIDLTKDQWACDGLVYTALSRVRSFGSLCVPGLNDRLIKTNVACMAFWCGLCDR